MADRSDLTVSTRLTPDGVVFEVASSDGAQRMEVFPLPADASHESTLLNALERLWVEEKLNEVPGGFELPWDAVYEMAPAQRRELDLPEPTADLDVELRTTGFAGRVDFRISALTAHPNYGLLPDDARTGPLFQLGAGPILVSHRVWDLLRLLDTSSSDGVSEQLLLIGGVRQAAQSAGARLDKYLASQEIFRPGGITIEVEGEAADRLTLRPVPGDEDLPNFPALGNERRPARSGYTRVEGNRRKRLVLSEQERKTADRVKERTELSGADVPKFLGNPEAYLPDEIDLSNFGLRVKGLVPRRYQSQPYLSLQTSGSRDWFDASVGIETLMEESEFIPPGTVAPGPLGSDIVGGEGAREQGIPSGTPNLPPATYADLCRQVVNSGEPYVLHDGDWIEIDPRIAERYLETWDLLESDEQGQLRISRLNAGLVLDVISNVEVLEFEPAPAEEPEPQLLPELPDYPIPETFAATLMPHQEIGYRWMRYLHEWTYGGLLADDMGLGKTVQVIAMLAHLSEQGQLRPALLVLPSAVLENWQMEIERFCPNIGYIYQHRGAGRERRPERIAAADLVLTTYETLRRDQLVLGQVDWSIIVCDEAQKVKNPTAQSTSAVKGMKGDLRLALTGTPVENGLSELWCIVDFAQPGKLGSRRNFRDEFERPVQEAADRPEVRSSLANRLQQSLTPHYLRRMKEDLLHDLPSKYEEKVLMSFGPRQERLYAGILGEVRRGDLHHLAALQYLIQVCSHPEILEPSGKGIEELIDECPKLQNTLTILEGIQARGEKVLLFTRSLRMQSILQEAIAHRFGQHSQIINGTITESRRRLSLVNQFNEAPGFRAMILSPDAAGVGLNIIGANHVVHYTRLWNPAKENQATDRVHRIGQTRQVTVYYPIVTGDGFVSVEQRLDELLAEKQQLARDVVWPRESLSVDRELKEFLETAQGGKPDG